MKFGVLVFPGSNCDHDTHHVLKHILGRETVFIWHQDVHLQGVDVVVVPGGFSYGDYLRCGAIAKFSPVMGSLRRHAESGGLVLGICNGFQILQEVGLLPGAMLPNSGLKFVCRQVFLRTENNLTPFSLACQKGQVLRMPIAHQEGNLFLSSKELNDLRREGKIVFRYCDVTGRPTSESNPNGSVDNIAGLTGLPNVLGLMPHPERAAERVLGSEDGLFIFRSIVESFCSK